MLKINLPQNFILDVTTLGAKLISELATIYNIEQTQENMYNAGKLLTILGISFAHGSQYTSVEKLKEDIEIVIDSVVEAKNNSLSSKVVLH